MSRAAISLTTGLEDPEKVTVALLVAVGAAEAGRNTLIFLTKEAVRLAHRGRRARSGVRGLPAHRRPDEALRGGGRRAARLPDLLQRQEPRRGHAPVQRPAGRDRPALGVDRRRRHDVQLLTGRHLTREDRRC